MKDLTIEEKAERYDVAIEKLRSLHDNYDTVSTLINVKEELEHIFPELKKSENERIRKELIDFHQNEIKYLEMQERTGNEWEIGRHKKFLSWLEKQGEKKPAWKPSDEQMMALRRMKAAIAGEGEIYKPLNSLYKDLKKLKEE